MNAGMKRNLKYIGSYQGKFMIYIMLFGFVYGIFLAFLGGANSIQEGLKSVFGSISMMAVIMPMAVQINLWNSQLNLMLSMGCTRKNMEIGVHAVTFLILIESFLWVGIAGNILQPHFFAGNYLLIYFLTACLLTNTVGIIGGLIMYKFGKTGLAIFFGTVWLFTVIIIFAGAFFIEPVTEERFRGFQIWFDFANLKIALTVFLITVCLYIGTGFCVGKILKKYEVQV